MVIVVGQNSAWQKTYWLGSITRGAVNRIAEVKESAAGKGSNACRVLVRYGVPHELHAYVGGANGQKFAAACRADGITLRSTEIERETRTCTTLIEEPDSVMTELTEPAPPISSAERDRGHALLFGRVGRASMLAICGTAMTGETDDCYRSFVAAAREVAVPVILDSYHTHGRLALEAGPEILKINREEFAELTGMPVDSLAERVAAYRSLIARYGLRWIVITHGSRGAEGFNGSAVVRVSPPAVTAVNPIGSGDSAAGGIIASVHRSGNSFHQRLTDADLLRAAVVEGVSAGTANCMNRKPGHVEPADLDWVRAHCSVETQRIE
ncbi:MAG: hypothetical protein EA384_05550 [Spirochaetaceae bacterium]|nr:MAG: hypothetical protein EA384_05550 [Spirochaetaceae bacterium]